MAKIIQLPTFSDKRGNLTVIEKVIPFDIKRVYYIYSCDGTVRGNHRHKKTRQAVICINGKVTFYCQSEDAEIKKYSLDSPNKCLIVEPYDFHWFDNFSKDSIILVMASELFDESDYVYKKY